ncbi:MAG TPA: hypothetical protein VJ810_20300 [Blastocatellia bacterium]|nr:hypothetical protein [Blastocatellia bacterium]
MQTYSNSTSVFTSGKTLVLWPQCCKNLWWTQDTMQEQALAAFEQSVKEFTES